ncbi:MAG: discoidin protein [Pedosphaera sp.]|nr:discoidin protein [Pedosphaera sp.]
MKNLIKPGLTPVLACAIALQIVALSTPAFCKDAPEKEALVLKLPDPTLKGTPEDLPTAPNIEPPSHKPATFMVPKGVTNVALGKPVTSSTAPFTGELTKITDGKKEAIDEDTVEFKKGLQWVQVDLGASYEIYALAVWHDHRYVQVMHTVIFQVSDDPEFKTNVTTIFNNDADNFAGLGAGTDRQYFETEQGKIINAKGVKARYIRGYTKGSSQGAQNAWEEIEAYALPGK